MLPDSGFCKLDCLPYHRFKLIAVDSIDIPEVDTAFACFLLWMFLLV